MSLQQPDMYYDNPPASRSPHVQRHQPALHRQSSRQFDSYAHLPSGLYGAEEQGQRYDAPRFSDNRMPAPPMHNNYGAYDMGAQTWNSPAFGNNALGGLGGSQRRRPQQAPRNGLPSVSII